MERSKTSRLRARGAAFSIALGMGGVVALLGASPARACGMIESRGFDFMSPRRAEQLLVAAARAANVGQSKRARTLALRVASAAGPTAAARARGWAVAGWASWQQGDRDVALRAFARARRLDPGATAIDTVLAQASPSTSVADLKKALAG